MNLHEIGGLWIGGQLIKGSTLRISPTGAITMDGQDLQLSRPHSKQLPLQIELLAKGDIHFTCDEKLDSAVQFTVAGNVKGNLILGSGSATIEGDVEGWVKSDSGSTVVQGSTGPVSSASGNITVLGKKIPSRRKIRKTVATPQRDEPYPSRTLNSAVYPPF